MTSLLRSPGTPPLRRRRLRRQTATALLFTTPFIVIFITFKAVPIVLTAVMSLTDMRTSDLRRPFEAEFVGFEKYITVLQDPGLLRAFMNTCIYVGIGVPITMAIGFLLALALNTGIRHFKGVFRAAFFAPVVTNVIAVAVIWKYTFSDAGPMNGALAALDLAHPGWLTDPALAIGTVTALGIWRNFGICMVIFLAGLQAIPEDVKEAAALDGAGRVRQVVSVTLPLLRPTSLLVSILMTINFLQTFEEPYLVTGGGPLGSTRPLALYIYEQFGYGNLATSAAASFILLLLIAGISALQFRVLRAKD